MPKIHSKKNIKPFLFGLFSGIFLSGLFLLIINNPHLNQKLSLVSDSFESYSDISTGSVICVNNDQKKGNFPLVNLNTSSIDELKSLSGIGDVKAKSILAWRVKYGEFKNISELMYISGISDSLFQQI
jgi:competence ComEA-like helix-hairpin-helix protein